MDRAKPFDIPKREVWEAYKKVRANQGAAGVDGQSIADFEADLANNLYKLWNRMASGSYFPPPVRRVDIPKGDGKTRPLGIPTVADRIAQMVVKRFLEPLVEPRLHDDSYGYRPGKSALDAVGAARQRCWRYAWVVDLDIKAFFDSIDTDLLMRAVRRQHAVRPNGGFDPRPVAGFCALFSNLHWRRFPKHTDCPWALLYIERWLKAPVQTAEGSLIERERGTPQGGVVSPLLANLFLHYAFDKWMQRIHPGIPFERYADDAICHCRSEEQAAALRNALEERFTDCGLTLHPEKTKIVYCKDDDRRGNYPNQKFDFLGYTFRPRLPRRRGGKVGVSFSPAAGDFGTGSGPRPNGRAESLARTIAALNPTLKGWFGYFKHATSGLKDVDAFVRRRLRAMLRKQAKRHGCGAARNDRIRWPNAFFASAGLFTLETAWRQARQSR